VLASSGVPPVNDLKTIASGPHRHRLADIDFGSNRHVVFLVYGLDVGDNVRGVSDPFLEVVSTGTNIPSGEARFARFRSFEQVHHFLSTGDIFSAFQIYTIPVSDDWSVRLARSETGDRDTMSILLESIDTNKFLLSLVDE